MATIQSVKTKIQGLIDKSNEATGGTDTDLTTAIDNLIANQGGGSSPIGEKAINFYDYDGTLLYSYTLEEAKELTSMPNLPTNERLVCDGWTHTLEEVQETTKMLTVGAMYHTVSGATEIDVLITEKTGLTVTFDSSMTDNGCTSIDWGDGTTDSTLTHTYSAYGEYAIKIYGLTSIGISGGTSNLTGANNQSILGVYLASGITAINTNAFARCYSLVKVTIPNTVTKIDNSAFSSVYAVKHVTIPNSCNTLGQRVFASVYALKSVVLPSSIGTMGVAMFNSCYSIETIVFPKGLTFINSNTCYSCYSLRNLVIPNTVTSLNYTNIFTYCYSLSVFDFSDFTAVPSLSSDAFMMGVNNSWMLYKIYVPSSLYSSWVTATQWENIKGCIVAV